MQRRTIYLWDREEYQYPCTGTFLPNITAYLHEGEETRPVMLVVPGGGYAMVSPSEGEIVAMKFYEAGYQAFVLTYTTNMFQVAPLEKLPLRDISRAVRYIRKYAEELLDLQAGNDIIMGGYRAEKLLDFMSNKAPLFGEDGAVVETVKSSHMGMVKTTLSQWGSFVPEVGGKDTVRTTVASGKELNERVWKAVNEGIATIQDNADGSKTITYHGTDRGACLARGTLQECAGRILTVLMNSAAMDDLQKR